MGDRRRRRRLDGIRGLPPAAERGITPSIAVFYSALLNFASLRVDREISNCLPPFCLPTVPTSISIVGRQPFQPPGHQRSLSPIVGCVLPHFALFSITLECTLQARGSSLPNSPSLASPTSLLLLFKDGFVEYISPLLADRLLRISYSRIARKAKNCTRFVIYNE
ncbi:hypothetical protein L596_003271 [Steinernema carpocapsae]|uniref:Uncharacterized protein n=1 Tax=Steinernema carpocapsae TaxID=34508 RepID=A0A4U8US19_STECR|nr:hypothetical protein L596_003271 [Steinernema carpocapsae]